MSRGHPRIHAGKSSMCLLSTLVWEQKSNSIVPSRVALDVLVVIGVSKHNAASKWYIRMNVLPDSYTVHLVRTDAFRT